MSADAAPRRPAAPPAAPRPAAAPARVLSAGDLRRVALARAAVTLCVFLLGFRAVSDDDYARVVIAQEWAHAPKLDPSGTSWLPFPFWLNGAAMLAFGRSLLVAQLVAVVLGVLSSLLVTVAAHRLGGDRRAAVIAGLFATLVGWSAWLGVATVPELFTAALTLFAAASLATRAPRARLLGALALVAATLSRYEPWSVAIAFAAWNLAGALREARVPGEGRARRVLAAALPSLVAVAGPLLWVAWNRVAHGDPLHFLARVSAYFRALGHGSNDGIGARLLAYPAAFAREMPEVLLPALVLAGLAAAPRLRPAVAEAARRCAAPLILAGVQVLALSLSLVKDGAPTHHPERAVLFPALALVVFTSAVAARVAPKLPRSLGPALAVLLLVRAAAAPVLQRSEAALRAVRGGWLLLYAAPGEGFADRRAETDIGARAAETLPPGGKIMIGNVHDYGYFAIIAGTAQPESVLLAADIDPRRPRPERAVADADAHVAWLRQQGVALLVQKEPPTSSDGRPFGVRRGGNGEYGIWGLPAPAPPPRSP